MTIPNRLGSESFLMKKLKLGKMETRLTYKRNTE